MAKHCQAHVCKLVFTDTERGMTVLNRLSFTETCGRIFILLLLWMLVNVIIHKLHSVSESQFLQREQPHGISRVSYRGARMAWWTPLVPMILNVSVKVKCRWNPKFLLSSFWRLSMRPSDWVLWRQASQFMNTVFTERATPVLPRWY